MNNAVFELMTEDVRKHGDIQLAKTARRKNYLVSQPNNHTTNFFTENLLAIEMKKTETLMNKPVYLGLSILELSKILMYEFWYDYLEPIYHEKAKLCYMYTDSSIVCIKRSKDDIYEDIAENVEARFDTSNYAIR